MVACSHWIFLEKWEMQFDYILWPHWCLSLCHDDMTAFPFNVGVYMRMISMGCYVVVYGYQTGLGYANYWFMHLTQIPSSISWGHVSYVKLLSFWVLMEAGKLGHQYVIICFLFAMELPHRKLFSQVIAAGGEEDILAEKCNLLFLPLHKPSQIMFQLLLVSGTWLAVWRLTFDFPLSDFMEL